ncbi:MAG: DUF790 family protein [Ktedonobacteraceae bacterium]
MRFSLQDVKRQVRRRDGELTVTLHFLRPGELRAEIARLVTYHEQLCGQPRKNFAQDEASACVGDYRLANCLLAVLSAWYAWRAPAWSTLLQELSEEARTALAESAISSPVHLRLALFDYVNAHYSGFLDEQTRFEALSVFATLYDLDVERLAYLLALDTEDEALLTRVSADLPDADEVAALYNQWAFEAALFNSSEVRFVIDCEAFLAAQRSEETGNAVTGIGAVIKRLCYLARKLGVYYDLAYEETLPGVRATLLHLTLYGPQDMTGTPQQYGLRLARLCRMLLLQYPQTGPKKAGKTTDMDEPGVQGGVYATQSNHSTTTSPRSVHKRLSVLSKAIYEAEATVHIFQQSYRFLMDAELLALLPAPEQENTRGPARVAESTAIYDSGIEQSFAEAFASLERGQGTDGWQLEREPEPLLFAADGAGTSGIFIPDFALTRDTRRIYVEILGFWTPAYRERKIQKLQHLRGHTDLILAIPIEARQVFAGLVADFPLVEYRGQLSATDLLRVLQTRYDDFEERLASLESTRVRASVRAARFVPERDCYTLLRCYRRSELPRAAALVLEPDMVYTPGLGLYLLDWLEHLRRSFVEWVEAQMRAELPLTTVIQQCRTVWPELATCDESTIEALLALWPEVRIQRASIFEAKLLVESLQGMESLAEEDAALAETPLPAGHGKKATRERRVASKKQVQHEVDQQNLWE